MNTMKIAGIILIILGVVALFYQGMTFVIPKDVLDLKYFSITINENRSIPLPPVVGIVSLAVGVAFVMFSGRGN